MRSLWSCDAVRFINRYLAVTASQGGGRGVAHAAPGRIRGVRRVWRQERGEIAQVAAKVALAAEGVGSLSTALGGGARMFYRVLSTISKPKTKGK